MSAALLDSLPRADRQGEPSWLAQLRRGATDRLRTTGFPTAKTEAWRFTPMKALTSETFAAASPVGGSEAGAARSFALDLLGDEDGTWRILVVNGVPLVTGDAPAGLRAETLADALARDPAAVEAHLGRSATPDHFAALNTALFTDALVLRATGKVERPVQVVYVSSSEQRPTAAYPRLLVIADEGAELELVETYLASEGERRLTSAVTEVAVGPAAIVDHLRVQIGDASESHIAALGVTQQRDSSYVSHVVALGGAVCRVDLDLKLAGEGASAILDGAYHAAGRDHVEHHTRVDHAVPRCTSNEEYRGIVDGSGHAVFDGTVYVRRDAQQTSAHQQNHNLLLADGATVHTKPHLEIDADDVSCSHGATIGALDDDSVFYLRARGIDPAQAEAILTFAFVKEILDRVRQPALGKLLGQRLRARLPHGETLGDLP